MLILPPSQEVLGTVQAFTTTRSGTPSPFMSKTLATVLTEPPDGYVTAGEKVPLPVLSKIEIIELLPLFPVTLPQTPPTAEQLVTTKSVNPSPFRSPVCTLTMPDAPVLYVTGADKLPAPSPSSTLIVLEPDNTMASPLPSLFTSASARAPLPVGRFASG